MATILVFGVQQNGIGGSEGINGKERRAKRDPHLPKRLYTIPQPPSLAAFRDVISQTTRRELYVHAQSIISNVPIYDIALLSACQEDPHTVDAIQDEWHHILLSGPGVFVLKHFYPPDLRCLIEKVNSVFSEIIVAEASSTAPTKGDHFAASGKNSRIWNSFEKHAVLDSASFVQYYSNPWLPRVAETWLGQSYQLTAQVNIVKPGGKPQVSHRDYHLGFQTADQCSTFPKATQIASQFLTLQGAVAHNDMPLESGPTRFLPFSQTFEEGYMAYRLREFQEFFEDHWVSVPLEMGDAVFFNPALFHAAGENTSADMERSANLLQISSAFGRTMESVDRIRIVQHCWEDVVKLYKEQGELDEPVEAVLKAVGYGYPFPTNLDRRPPDFGGMAPENEVDVLRRALQQDMDTTRVVAALSTIRSDSLSQS